MKANAPEKLYVDVHDNLSDSILYGFTEKRTDDDIEYIRTDTIEVKEVKEEPVSNDLEREIKHYVYDPYFDLNGVAVKGATDYLTVEDVADIARHFAQWQKKQEAKKVDIEKEFDNYTKDILACDIQFEPFTHLHNCAKYFFGLGLKAKGE